MNDKRFYVYIYLDPRRQGPYIYNDGKEKFIFEEAPFYVGKGVADRMYHHLTDNPLDRNNLKKNKIKKIKQCGLEPKIIKLKQKLTDEEAKLLEKRLIRLIGRQNLNRGPLTNLTNGGDGTYGYKPSESAKKNWRKSIKKHYSIEKNRKKIGFLSTKEGMISKYGIEEGTQKYNERIKKMSKSVRQAYKNKNLCKRCANAGVKNGMHGITPPTAKQVKVGDKLFSSIEQASRELVIPYTTLSYRLKSKNFIDYVLI